MTDGRVSAVLAAVEPDAYMRLGVVAKRTYLVDGGRLIEAPQQVGLVEAPVLSEDGVLLRHDTDLILRKAKVDVVVSGHVFPYAGERQSLAKIQVGVLSRTILVHGDRRIELDAAGRARFTPPECFEEIPLGWERAYGGYDAAALEAYGDPTEDLRRQADANTSPQFGLYAYPRNPVGRGYLVELTPRAMEICQLPNLEEPSQALRPDVLVHGNSLAWPVAPVPCSTMWLPYTFFPRMTLFGFPPPMFDEERFPADSFYEVHSGLLAAKALDERTHVAELYDVRGAQGAAPGMRVSSVQPGDWVELTNIHPKAQTWRFPLAVRPPQLTVRVSTQRPVHVVPVIRTVLLEPEYNRVCIVWVGEYSCERPINPQAFGTIEHAVIWA